MAENRGVAYMGTGKVEVQNIDFPGFEVKDGPGVNPDNVGRQLPHAAILKIVSTNICGSDQHMVRGRTTAPDGLILGHEITGEVIETGPGVEFIQKGDLCSVPFNIACGRCRRCKTGDTGVCLNVNPDRPGSAYGYVDMGGWVGGQAEYVTVPYADWNLLKFPDKEQAMEKILDLTMLSDIFPTGYHGCYTAGVTSGSTVYIAGAGPVGLAAAHSAQLLGAAVVIVGDMVPERLRAGGELRLRDDRHHQGRPGRPDRADPRRARGRRRRRRGRLRGARPRRRRRARGPGHRAQLADDPHPRRGQDRHPRALRHRRPGRRGRGRPGGLAVDPDRPRLGAVAQLRDRPVPGHEVPPRADADDPAATRRTSRRRSTRPSSRSTRRRRAIRTSTRAPRRSSCSTRMA